MTINCVPGTRRQNVGKCLDARIRSIGYEIVTDRGDYREFFKRQEKNF